MSEPAKDPGALLSGTPTAPAPAPEAPVEAPAATPPAPEKKGPVPYSRFEEVNGEKNALQTELEALRAAEAERQRAALSDLERAQQDAQSHEQAAAAATVRATVAERSMQVWKEAHATGFRVPDDAVTFLQTRLDSLDSPDKIKQAVRQLAQDRGDLVGAVNAAPTAIGAPATPSAPTAEVPLGADGKPDHKRGLGQDLLAHLRRQYP